jgi:type VI secretion system protein ImpA
MPSAALLNFDELVQPVAGDSPAGAPVALPVRQKLDAARKETEPHPDDPSQGEVPRKADWSGIVKTARELLAEKSKDLLLAARLTEALTKMHGFAGLRDGLHLLHELIAQCWDRLHPTPDEDEGMEIRAGPFHWLSDADRGARFPGTVRGVPLVAVNGQSYSWQDWKLAQDGRGPIPQEEFTKAAPLNPGVAEDLAQAVEELGRLDQTLVDRLGPEAPGMIDLRQALEDCRTLLQTVLRHQPAAAEPEAGAAVSGNGAAAPGVAGGGGTLQINVATREEAYRQLAVIANTLERLEPHSPIPDLLRRAIELGKMPFRQLVRELVRDQGQLTELRREFGIREPEPSG